MREVILDTETTGLDPAKGHRIIEIGCLELINHIPTRQTFQRFVNPGMPVPADAQGVHGITDAFLADKPDFSAVAGDLLAFLGDARLVIHNAEFDLGFINAELSRLGLPSIPSDRAIDTVTLARRKYPGAPANLDALCKRFAIDLSGREKHGAMLDAELLAQVYIELIGGKQVSLALVRPEERLAGGAPRHVRPPRPHAPTPEELAAHQAFVAKLPNPIWLKP